MLCRCCAHERIGTSCKRAHEIPPITEDIIDTDAFLIEHLPDIKAQPGKIPHPESNKVCPKHYSLAMAIHQASNQLACGATTECQNSAQQACNHQICK
jgi:hypothetical protein